MLWCCLPVAIGSKQRPCKVVRVVRSLFIVVKGRRVVRCGNFVLVGVCVLWDLIIGLLLFVLCVPPPCRVGQVGVLAVLPSQFGKLFL